MHKARVRITTPYPTVDTVVKTFRIPPTQARKVLALVDQIIAQRGVANGTTRSANPKARRRRRSKG
jgi:hypothetical protein